MKLALKQDSFIMRSLTRITDTVLLNMLFLISCIPIFTIGAALTSLNTSWQRVLREDDQLISYHYFRIFKVNFFKSIVLGIGLLTLGGVFLLDFLLVIQQAGIVKYIGLLILSPFVIAWILMMSISFTYTGRYEDNIKKVVTNSLLIALNSPIYSLFLVITNLSIIYFSISSPERLMTAIYFFTFGGISLISLLNNFIVKKMFDKIEKITV